jgi:hypothetical protein
MPGNCVDGIVRIILMEMFKNLYVMRSTIRCLQKWSRHGRAVVLLSSGQCLESGITSEVRLSECRRGALSQQWDFTVELQAQEDHPVNIT